MSRPQEPTRSPGCHAAAPRYDAITTGLLMVAGGIVLILQRQGVVDAREYWRWLPVLMLIPAGREIVANETWWRGLRRALVWIAVGTVFLLEMHGYSVLRADILVALAFVAGGVWLLWRPEPTRRSR